MSSSTIESRPTNIIYLLFFVSGTSSLIYEVIWVKLFSLVFGNTTFAVSAVLSAFFSGLALGSYILGHYSDRYRGRYISLYGSLELLIGLYALALPKLVSTVHSVYFPLIRQDESFGFYELSFYRFILAFVLLILPTTLMGATLPILSKLIVSHPESMGTSIGRLYSFNTFGATAGCLLTGLVMIAIWGISTTNLIAVSLNILVGVWAIYLARGEDVRNRIFASGKEKTRYTYISCLLLLSFAISGFCALGYEVIWVRVLSTVFAPTTYSFSIMLTTYLFGLAMGSLIIARYVDRIRFMLPALGAIELSIGIMAAWMLFFFKRLPGWFAQMKFESWIGMLTLEALICFALLLPVTFLLGATFPLVGKFYTRNVKRIGGSIGSIYAVNTIGGILGSMVAGFVLLPLFGVKTGILILATANVFTGIMLLLSVPGGYPRKNTVILAGVSLYGVSLIFFLNYQFIPGISSIEGKEVLFYDEDVSASVMVQREDNRVALLVNNIIEGSSLEMETLELESKLGHFPLLLHPDPKKVLVIGLGTGISSGAISSYDVERVEVVDIVPGLLETLKFFKIKNRNIYNDPRFHFTIDDGRNFMVTPGETYDVIISEIYHPDTAGTGNLYAKEYYESARNRLNPGGLFAQWLTLYELGPREFQSILATMHRVFPYLTVWLPDPIFNPVAMVVGKTEDLMIDLNRFEKRLQDPGIAGDLMERDNPISLLSSYVMDEKGLREFIQGAIINTDNFPYIEYATPRYSWKRNQLNLTVENLQKLLPFIQPVYSHLMIHQDDGVKEEIQKYYEARKHVLQSEIYGNRGDYEQQISQYMLAAAIDVNDPIIHIAMTESVRKLVEKLKDQGNHRVAQKYQVIFEVMQNANPYNESSTLSARAFHLAVERRYKEAENLLHKAILFDPGNKSLQSSLETIYKIQKTGM